MAVIVGTFVFVLPQFANYGEVCGAGANALLGVDRHSPRDGGAERHHIRSALDGGAAGSPLPPALTVTQASTPGPASRPEAPRWASGFRAAMLLAWGFHADQVALAVTLTGIWNQLAILGFPAVAFALLTLTGGDGAALQTIATIGLAAFVVVAAAFAAALSSPRMARRVGDLAARVVNRLLRIVRRGPVGWSGESLVRFRRAAIGLIRRRWHILTLATLAGQLRLPRAPGQPARARGRFR